jgi:hypothetical protein
MKDPVQLHFAAIARPTPAPCRCPCCAWTGPPSDVAELGSVVDWLGHQDPAELAILPVGACPNCNAPIYDPLAERRLARALAALAKDDPP